MYNCSCRIITEEIELFVNAILLNLEEMWNLMHWTFFSKLLFSESDKYSWYPCTKIVPGISGFKESVS